MKTQNTQQQIDNIKAALSKMHVRLFDEKSGDPKYNAQRNLSGLTHYYDDESLRWHKSRVLSDSVLFGGLLFATICSDGKGFNTSDGRCFRYVIHDVFGNCVERPNLDSAFSTSKAAKKAFDALEIDLVAHYRATLQAVVSQKESELNDIKQAAAML